MTLSDLLFILVFLSSLGALAIFGFTRRARVLQIWAICFAVYMAIVFAVALATPRRIGKLGEDHCSDDWCIAVEGARQTGNEYTVTFKLSSRARRVSQREKGQHVYLTDALDRRFDPLPDASAIPLDVLLGPGESVETQRKFVLPGDASDVGVVVTHEGSYYFPGCFIIGDDVNPVRKPAVVPLSAR